MAKGRIIAHFDLDAFFVSVECINDPSLKGKPLIVGGSSDRGVVAACSYEARKYGMHSAMPMRTAMRLCPHAIVVGGSRGEYSKYSRWVTEIIAGRAPLFEKASIDEFYLDLTGMDKYFRSFQWTVGLAARNYGENKTSDFFALCASNKMVAKIATDEAKPNGYLQVPEGMEKEFLGPLPVSKIPGVGEQTYLRCCKWVLKQSATLRQFNLKELEDRLANMDWNCIIKLTEFMMEKWLLIMKQNRFLPKTLSKKIKRIWIS